MNISSFKKKIKKILTSDIFLTLVISLVSSLVFVIYHTITEKNEFDVFSVSILGVVLLFLAACISQIIYALYRRSEEKIAKSDFELNTKLYYWLGENYISEKFIISTFDDSASSTGNIIENLNKTKQILKEACGDELENYKLLKNHLEFRTEGKLSKKIHALIISIMSTGILAGILSFLKAKLNNADFIRVILQFTSSNLEEVILLIWYVIFIILLSIVTYNIINFKNKRIQYLISILNILIEEKK